MSLADRLGRPATVRTVLLTAGLFGWVTFALLTWQMYGNTPPSAGFDLELLIAGGRSVASGTSPYDPAMLNGQSVEIADLFYSYPPVVAQFFSLVAFLPSPAIFGVAVAMASLATVLVGRAVAAVFGSDAVGKATLLPLAALLPFWFPYTVGMLFGNVDIFFPALYGLVLLALASPAGGPGSRGLEIAGGLALAVASIIKLHPAVLGLWLIARGVTERRRGHDLRRVGPAALPRSWRIAATASAAVAVMLAASLAAGGLQPWIDYAAVLRAGVSVDLLDVRNLGPAVQLVLLSGLGPSAVAPIQLLILALALIVTIVAALKVHDPLESLTWAAAMSFIVLPVTWFHHFAALIPFGIGALARGLALDRRTRRRLWMLLLATFVITMVGFAQAPTWLLVPTVLWAARISRPGLEPPQGASPPTTIAPAPG